MTRQPLPIYELEHAQLKQYIGVVYTNTQFVVFIACIKRIEAERQHFFIISDRLIALTDDSDA